MDVVCNPLCKPHALAENVLFKHKRQALSVFSDVIGMCEIDHISIACINSASEAVFLSHTPSIEYHLMASELWQYDLLNHADFYRDNQSRLWSELYHTHKYFELNDIKQVRHGFLAGFSIPVKHNDCYLVYSFATRSQDINPSLFFYEQQHELVKMGHYCFNRLSEILLAHTFNDKSAPLIKLNQHLKLVVNNKRCSPSKIAEMS